MDKINVNGDDETNENVIWFMRSLLREKKMVEEYFDGLWEQYQRVLVLIRNEDYAD